MTTESSSTFIVDCSTCKAKVAAIESGCAIDIYFNEEAAEPFGEKVFVGNCPKCRSILVGRAYQTAFAGYEGDHENRWGDIVRVYPNPPKTFSSWRIPKTVSDSLKEADLALQAGANTAACVMLGRSLEAICRNILEPKSNDGGGVKKTKNKLMLGDGIKKLHDAKIIDDRLYDWSQQLHAFRNLAAHPDEDITISRRDTEDLQTFVNAIVEYIYDLTDLYSEFKKRVEKRRQHQEKHFFDSSVED